MGILGNYDMALWEGLLKIVCCYCCSEWVQVYLNYFLVSVSTLDGVTYCIPADACSFNSTLLVISGKYFRAKWLMINLYDDRIDLLLKSMLPQEVDLHWDTFLEVAATNVFGSSNSAMILDYRLLCLGPHSKWGLTICSSSVLQTLWIVLWFTFLVS